MPLVPAELSEVRSSGADDVTGTRATDRTDIYTLVARLVPLDPRVAGIICQYVLPRHRLRVTQLRVLLNSTQKYTHRRLQYLRSQKCVLGEALFSLPFLSSPFPRTPILRPCTFFFFFPSLPRLTKVQWYVLRKK